MEFSDRFLNLVQQELNSFNEETGLENVVVYVAQTHDEDAPTLEVIGQIPSNIKRILTPIANDPDLRAPSPNRRWYPLQEGSILLGVIRAERFASEEAWPELLDKRLQASAFSLSNSLSLELDRKKLLEELNQQKEQIGMLVHQIKNPLAALRTYAQLLLRKLGPESSQRNLVESLITEQKQFDKYLVALDELSQSRKESKKLFSERLLLPPLLPNSKSLDLRELIEPLLKRAAAKASLQGREWVAPITWPDWILQERPVSEGVIAEIVANLLENAFRYSPADSAIGLFISEIGICVWDSGEPIPLEDRDQIFYRGFRSANSLASKGSGLGLALGKELAEQLGGELYLDVNPQGFHQSLPKKGNAFILKLPVELLQE
ncbi:MULTISPECIES: sensor histidine kinase [Prochlorococcus]|uniref:sensor histidine kinase n=1 Tax=Prochlorococcus TaxID=1218 RepID=UPI000533B5BD|nr:MULTISPECIES: HAMP domain-containing sensor histidine kinase [Prochlorococcus]KGG13094.1 two-component sensor histidine kinase [Prochlorococcus sp. MIT 0601]